jgi:ABC-type uncharacterized transport system substrate-binding protein
MRDATKRLALGIGLIAAASAILLLSDLRHRTAAAASLTRTWHVAFVEFNLTVDVEDAEKGVLDGLKEAGLAEGHDFTHAVTNAHGDMATVSALIDAAVGDRADLIVTFSTPTLQAAVQRAKTTPVVFTYVSDAVVAGAGRSDTDHAPNITGVYLIGAYGQMMPYLHQVAPRAHVLGTVYVPAEVNMVSQLPILEKAAAAAGYTVKTVAANTAAEVQDAALALVSNHVDAICQIPGNLTASAFPSIAQVAKRARVPMFVYQTSQVQAGALLAVARDYYDSGRDSGKMAARVMRGESPAAIPFSGYAGTRLIVNTAAAKAIGFTIPAAIVAEADRVIDR